MNPIDTIKTVGKIIISLGVGNVVSNAVKCTTPVYTGAINRICINVGGFVLACMVSDKTVDYAEKIFDETLEHINVSNKPRDLN